MHSGIYFAILQFVSALCQHERCVEATRLGRLSIDKTNFTITGFSSGASMSIQFHISYSSKISAVGMFAAHPYLSKSGQGYPIEGILGLTPTKTFSEIIPQIDLYEAQGLIDPTKYLSHSRVYIFQGAKDATLPLELAETIKRTYEHYGASQISYVIFRNANHAMPANNIGGPCPTLNPQNLFVNDCKYDGVFEMYNYLYGGNLRRPTFASVGTVVIKGEILEFDQTPFLRDIDPIANNMDKVGFLYIPSGCKSGFVRCRVSFALHGCTQCRSFVGDRFVRQLGYLEVAELNNIILVFPQVLPDKHLNNSICCFDYYGFTGKYHATKLGLQNIVLKRMMDRIFLNNET